MTNMVKEMNVVSTFQDTVPNFIKLMVKEFLDLSTVKTLSHRMQENKPYKK